MLCHQTQALSKRGNLEQHHNANHQKLKDSYPPKSAIHARKADKLKSELKAQWSLRKKPSAQNKAATEVSFHLRQLLVKHKKPFNGFKNKDIKSARASTSVKGYVSLWIFFTTVRWTPGRDGHSSVCGFPRFCNKGGFPRSFALDPRFLTDLMAKLNSLSKEFQGKDPHLPHMISAVNAFKAKFGVWITHLKNGRMTHFPNLKKMLQAIKDTWTK